MIGQILLAKSKIQHECLHDVEVSIKGVKVSEMSEGLLGKVYRGQQLVFFGKYADGGEAEVTMRAKLTGEDQVYRTRFEFPDVATEHPELDRLWAMDRIERIEMYRDRGRLDGSEAEDVVRELGLSYQLVTDQTTMLVMVDEAFDERGIVRANRERVRVEREAQQVRKSMPARTARADSQQPLTPRRAPRLFRGNGGGGGGDIGGVFAGVVGVLMLVTGYVVWRGKWAA